MPKTQPGKTPCPPPSTEAFKKTDKPKKHELDERAAAGLSDQHDAFVVKMKKHGCIKAWREVSRNLKKAAKHHHFLVDSAERGFRSRQYQEAGKLCALADTLKNDANEWHLFWSESGLEKPTKEDAQEDALRHIVKATTDLTADVSSLWICALRVLQDDGVAARDVATALKNRGGFRTLAAEGAARRKEAKVSQGRQSGVGKPTPVRGFTSNTANQKTAVPAMASSNKTTNKTESIALAKGPSSSTSWPAKIQLRSSDEELYSRLRPGMLLVVRVEKVGKEIVLTDIKIKH